MAKSKTRSPKKPAPSAAKKKTAAKKKPAAAKKRSGSNRGTAKTKLFMLGDKDRDFLKRLDAGTFERSLDVPVSQLKQEARDLQAVLRRYGKALLRGTRLTAKTPSELAERSGLLDRAEQSWSTARVMVTPADLAASREEAETLRRDLVAAVRYFLAGNAEVQRRVDRIQEGTGLADLLDDLGKLAALTDEFAAALGSADLGGKKPAQAAARGRELAEMLGAGSADRVADRGSADSLAIRNRAFWFLREVMEEIRAAGRYVFRAEPAVLKLFMASRSLNRAARRRKAKAKTKKGGEAGAGGGGDTPA